MDNYPNTAHRVLNNTTENDWRKKIVTFDCSLIFIGCSWIADDTLAPFAIASLVVWTELVASFTDLTMVVLLAPSIATRLAGHLWQWWTPRVWVRRGRWITIQLTESGLCPLSPNSYHLAPLWRWWWRGMVKQPTRSLGRSFSFFYSSWFTLKGFCSSWSIAFLVQKLFPSSSIPSHCWWSWFLLLLLGSQSSVPHGVHREGEVGSDCQREGEGEGLASQRLAKVQTLWHKLCIFFMPDYRCRHCSHFHSLYLDQIYLLESTKKHEYHEYQDSKLSEADGKNTLMILALAAWNMMLEKGYEVNLIIP